MKVVVLSGSVKRRESAILKLIAEYRSIFVHDVEFNTLKNENKALSKYTSKALKHQFLVSWLDFKKKHQSDQSLKNEVRRHE